MNTAGLLSRVWALGFVGIFLFFFWIPFSAIVFYNLLGIEGAVIALAVILGLIFWARDLVKRKAPPPTRG